MEETTGALPLSMGSGPQVESRSFEQAKEEAQETLFLSNRTPKRLEIPTRSGGILVLSPLETREMLSAELDDLVHPVQLEPFILDNRIRIEHESEIVRSELPQEIGSQAVGWATGLAVIVYVALNSAGFSATERVQWALVGGVLAGLIRGIAGVWKSAEPKKRELGMRTLRHLVSLAFVLMVSIGLPVLSFYFVAGGRELLAGQSPAILGVALQPGELALARFGRILQLIFIITASLLPALLYFLFDRIRQKTLLAEFHQQIFRLDPYVENLTDVETKYGSMLEEVLGTQSGEGVRLVPGTRRPIFIATLVFTLGWILALIPSGMTAPISQPSDLFKFFVPQPNAIVFGFLGAYYFGVNTILRRYTRGDLRPKAYSTITVRIFVVIILAWILQLYFADGTPTLLLTCFFIGVFPERGLFVIKSFAGVKPAWDKLFPGLEEKHQVTHLDGIDLYDSARLFDEGVTNIESLAHHNLIDLLIQTRIPASRLVDWVDQAILYLHLAEPDKPGTPSAFAVLKQHGIRTATDLLKARDEAKKRGGDEVSKLLEKFGGGAAGGSPIRFQVILDALEDDEWLNYILKWRESGERPQNKTLAPASA